MPDSPEIKIVRMEGKLDTLLEKINHVNDSLEKEYVTKDQLSLLLAPLDLTRKIAQWLVVIVGTQLVGLVFYVIQRLLFKQ